MSSPKRHKPEIIPKTYQIVPGPEMGLVSPEILENIAKVASKYNIPLLKITAAQRLAFVGHNPDDITDIWHELGYDHGPPKPVGVHYVHACPGLKYCKYGRQDSLELGTRLQDELMGTKLPAKTKIGVSGCAMNCCESYIRDLGIFGKKNGWTLVFGGNGGGHPRIGDIIGTDLDDSQVIDLARRCLQFYKKSARPKERTARFMERTNLEDFKKVVDG